jgi:hypothetical protein
LLYAVTAVALSTLPLGILFSGSLFSLDTRVVDQIGEVEADQVDRDTKAINVWFQAVSFDPETQKARFNIYPWPSDDLVSASFASSTVTNRAFVLFVDELDGQGVYEFGENQVVGSIASELDVLSYLHQERARDSYYPFDRYVLDTYVDVALLAEDGAQEPIRTFDYFYTNSVSGFQISYQRVAAFDSYLNDDMYRLDQVIRERDAGKISFLATFERSFAVKLTVIVLCLLILLNALMLVWIAGQVMSKTRPPSMQALIWSAASVLATIQLRDLYPGKPRLGIAVDYFIFFPSMLASMLVGVVLTASWTMRSDYHV